MTLRREAREEGKSLNQVTVEALERTLGLDEKPRRRRDLSDIRGTWVEESETAAALEDLRRVDLSSRVRALGPEQRIARW